jgi:hypothetical protein
LHLQADSFSNGKVKTSEHSKHAPGKDPPSSRLMLLQDSDDLLVVESALHTCFLSVYITRESWFSVVEIFERQVGYISVSFCQDRLYGMTGIEALQESTHALKRDL